jgi:3-phosphoshikimate 1-carboxyvinyltransferase
MERVAAPLREMGARVRTVEGHAPVEVEGGGLRGIRYVCPVPSAQVKGAVLLAGVAASGETTVIESAATRDHTERALRHLGAPIRIGGGEVSVSWFQHEGFEARVPGDVSSAAFLAAATAITGGQLVVHRVGLNPSRTRYLDVMRRMGVGIEVRGSGQELGEPVGELVVGGGAVLRGTTVGDGELPLVIDEVPVLAALAAHARDETRFRGAGELRVKESDRLGGLVDVLRSLGGNADVEGDDLIVAGGGLAGGRAESRGDHRMAMAATVMALGASQECSVEGVEAADVSFPGFLGVLCALGAHLGR